jgi:hypothetical protein
MMNPTAIELACPAATPVADSGQDELGVYIQSAIASPHMSKKIPLLSASE